MDNYFNQLKPLRFWNRAGIIAFFCMLPITIIVSFVTKNTSLFPYISFLTFGGLNLFIFLCYYRIRKFHCPKCDNYFAINSLGANSIGRACTHCGLNAYAHIHAKSKLPHD